MRRSKKVPKRKADAGPAMSVPMRASLGVAVAAVLVLSFDSVREYIYTALAIDDMLSRIETYAYGLDPMASAQKKKPPALHLGSYNVSIDHDQIERVSWRAGGRFLRKIVSDGVPVLIEGAPVAEWPIRKWDLLQMAKGEKHTPLYLNATRFQQGQPVFVLGREREKGGMLGKADRNLQYVDMDLDTFIHHTFDPSRYFYWTGMMAALLKITSSIRRTRFVMQ
jgi:hypothetical protein